MIVDRSQLKASPLLYKLSKASILLFNDKKVTIAHNKIMIIDQHTVITGSYNFTSSVEHRNAENLLLIHSPDLASVYQKNWNQPFLFFPKARLQKKRRL